MADPSTIPIVPATSDQAALYSPPKEKSEVVVAKALPDITQWGAIRSPSLGPSKAMEARFTCETCNRSTIVQIGWNASALARQIKMKEALDLHRLICPVGLPEDMRTYRIHYPRS